MENAVRQLCMGSCRIIAVSGVDLHEGLACSDQRRNTGKRRLKPQHIVHLSRALKAGGQLMGTCHCFIMYFSWEAMLVCGGYIACIPSHRSPLHQP